MEKSESIAALAASLVTAQAKIKSALKDSVNPHYRNHYADLASVVTACKDALLSEGIAIIQSPVPADPGHVALQTVLLHKSGEWVGGTVTMKLQKDDPQGYGSGLTYARRYGLAAIANVCSGEDDDGNAASGRNGTTPRAAATSAPKPAAKPEVHPDLSEVEIGADEQFEIRLTEAYESRGFTPERAKQVIRSTFIAKKWGLYLKDTPMDERTKWIEAVKAGKFDELKEPKRKTNKPEMAGANA